LTKVLSGGSVESNAFDLKLIVSRRQKGQHSRSTVVHGS
jgi:hypothetical protein